MYLLSGTLARLPTTHFESHSFSRTRRPSFFQHYLLGRAAGSVTLQQRTVTEFVLVPLPLESSLARYCDSGR
jgi:hypothetical protein